MTNIKGNLYEGTLTDKINNQTIKFSHKNVYEVLTHFSMIIEDCKLDKTQIKIIKRI